MNTVYFDMDGTIADLYGVGDWLNKLRSEDVSPYEEATPLVNAIKFQILINRIKRKGYKVGVISWTSKGGKAKYNKQVAQAKKDWLEKTFPRIVFDEVHVVKYGTSKSSVAFNPKGILFDDDETVRKDWRGIAFSPDMIEKILSSLWKKGLTK